MEPSLTSLSTLIGQVGLVGTASLIALHLAGRNVAEDELRAIVHVDSSSTLRNALRTCEIHDYATHVQRARRDIPFWHITDIGKSIVLRVISLLGLPGASTGHSAATAQPRLIAADVLAHVEEKNFFSSSPSSSSDQIFDQSDLDSDLTEEDEEEREFKKFLCRKYDLTGPKAAALIADRRVTPLLIAGWMDYVKQLVKNHTHFRKSPEAYALGCLLHADGSDPDDPPESSRHSAYLTVDGYRREFDLIQSYRDDEDEDQPGEAGES